MSKDNIDNIGIYVRSRRSDLDKYISKLCQYLEQSHINYSFERTAFNELPEPIRKTSFQLFDAESAADFDLLIIIGGDGSFLHACKLFANKLVPLLGINLGRLGFLTDISFSNLEQTLKPILSGKSIIETRYFLSGSMISSQRKQRNTFFALNDIVIQTSKPGDIIDLEVSINNISAFTLRCDGMIIASSTGSTAYALSAGGPILHPAVDAMVLVPLAAHDLSARPSVIPTNTTLQIEQQSVYQSAHVNFDGSMEITLMPKESITINVSKQSITLAHPPSYDYFAACRSKLGWHGSN